MRIFCLILASGLLLAGVSGTRAQQAYFNRLPPELLNIRAPSLRVSGGPGEMRFSDTSCRSLPGEGLRRRIVHAAVQEWAFFGFSIYDLTEPAPPRRDVRGDRRRLSRMDAGEAERVAGSIGGYWAVTPDSAWILRQQNEAWQGPRGLTSRWRHPWSAAFISWVMCESGLAETRRFERAVAHHTYIDQAILAREAEDSQAAFTAWDPGQQPLGPGDLLCRGSRPDYQNITQRRAQLGTGARTHCDIVVKLDAPGGRILAIGGNVRGSVRLKLLPATATPAGHLAPVPYDGRRIFAHLRLAAEPVEADAFERSPTLRSVRCDERQGPLPPALMGVAQSPDAC